MSGRTFEEQEQIRSWISIYLFENGMTSLRNITAWLEQKTNEYVSPSTVARLVRRMGYEMKKGEWVKR